MKPCAGASEMKGNWAASNSALWVASIKIAMGSIRIFKGFGLFGLFFIIFFLSELVNKSEQKYIH